jgi:ketosteroid isomerase-like protein
MSQENVEIVEALYRATDVDWVRLVRDDALWAAWIESIAQLRHPDIEVVRSTGPNQEGDRGVGADGMRAAMLDWFAPLDSFEREVEKTIDLGERVLVLTHERGRLHGSEAEVEMSGSHLLTFRDGKIARWETFADRAEALKAVGLEE